MHFFLDSIAMKDFVMLCLSHQYARMFFTSIISREMLTGKCLGWIILVLENLDDVQRDYSVFLDVKLRDSYHYLQ